MRWNNVIIQSPLWTVLFLYVTAFAFAISALCVQIMRQLAPRLGLVDYPGERKIHTEPTPLLGGVAVFMGVYLTIFINIAIINLSLRYGWFDRFVPSEVWMHYKSINVSLPKIAAFFAGGLAIFLFGLYDDRKDTGAFIRLIQEIIVATIVVALGIRPAIYDTSQLLGFIVTVFWIVGITNAFNLIDGINGLCAGNALISTLIFFAVSLRGKSPLVCVLLMTFAGALVGFLIFNFPKAKIFLGSAGSMFIGYTLAVLTLFQSVDSRFGPSNPLPFVMPALVLSIPLIDTLSVMYIRFRTHRPLFKADNNHLHHRLRRLRMNDTEAVLFLFLATFTVGINATLLYKATMAESALILVQAGAIYFMLAALVFVKERRLHKRQSANGKLIAHMFLNQNEKAIFEGIVNDISRKGINFTLLNIEKRFSRQEFFTGREMKAQLLPGGHSFHGATPFLETDLIVRWESNVAENAVVCGADFKETLKEKDELLETLFYLKA